MCLDNATVEETEDHVGDTADETEEGKTSDRPKDDTEVQLTVLRKVGSESRRCNQGDQKGVGHDPRQQDTSTNLTVVILLLGLGITTLLDLDSLD